MARRIALSGERTKPRAASASEHNEPDAAVADAGSQNAGSESAEVAKAADDRAAAAAGDDATSAAEQARGAGELSDADASSSADETTDPEQTWDPDEPQDPDEPRDHDDADSAEDGEGATRRPGNRLVAVLAAATVLIGAFGVWATVAAHHLRSAAASANTALVDRAATGAITRDITRTVDTIFSYSYADTARTRTAAQRALTGKAIKQYNLLFALVEKQAPKEKLVLTTKVTDIGVELLTGNRARLLVFANQQDTRAGTTQASYSGAMFAVNAVIVHGSWKIESIDTFTSP